MNKTIRIFILTVSLLLSLGLLANGNASAAQETAAQTAVTADMQADMKADTQLEQDIQSLKKDVLKLNKNLFILEEDLLFPANTQFSVFISMDSGQLFALDSVQLKIDDKVVANHLYTERELHALQRGGVQRLYIGNLASGKHEIIAIYTGKGPNKRDYRRGQTVEIEKGSEPQFIELQIIDDPTKEQPVFKTRVWE
jgi:hypothetical protein